MTKSKSGRALQDVSNTHQAASSRAPKPPRDDRVRNGNRTANNERENETITIDLEEEEDQGEVTATVASSATTTNRRLQARRLRATSTNQTRNSATVGRKRQRQQTDSATGSDTEQISTQEESSESIDLSHDGHQDAEDQAQLQTDEGNGNASTSVNSSTIATRRQKRQRRAETDPDAEHTGTLSSTGVQGNSSTCHKTSNTSSSVRQRRQGSAQRSESLVVSSGNNSGMACPEDPTPASDDEGSLPGQWDESDLPARPITDIDYAARMHSSYVTTYSEDVFRYFRSREVPPELRSDYMEQIQRDINPGMRAVLIDWLVEVTEEYRLVPETLYHAVQLVDRCLSLFSVHRTRLQLLGCAALLIAAKIEELFRNAPTVAEYVYISDNTYRRKEVLNMEAYILQQLQFRLRAITPKTYMSRFLRAAGATKGDILTNLVKYLTELTLPEYRFLKYRPSEIAAAAVLCARMILNINSPWTQDLEYYTGYKQADIKICAEDIAQAHRDAPTNTLQAINEKYSHAPYLRVSQNPRCQPLRRAAIAPLETAPSSASVAAGVRSNQFA